LPLTGTEPITTSVDHHGGVAVLAVGGEIDLVTAPSFEKAINEVLADDPPNLVIDLSEVTFLASAGLQLLVATNERIDDSTGFAVVAEGPATSRPIELTDLDKIFDLYPSLDDALEALRAKRRLR
jgi:anti-sigma B factor antagonist